MATLGPFQWTVPDGTLNSIVIDFCAAHGYTATIADDLGGSMPNPEPRPQFMKRMMKEFIANSVRSYRAAQAYAAADAAIEPASLE